MRKSIILVIIGIFYIAILSGCSKAIPEYKPPPVCFTKDGAQKPSIILDSVPHPNETAVLLKTNTAVLITQNHVKADIILNFLDSVYNMVSASTTYADLYSHVQGNIIKLNKEVGAAVMILSQYSSNFAMVDKSLYECDKYLLKKHIREQEMLVMALSEED